MDIKEIEATTKRIAVYKRTEEWCRIAADVHPLDRLSLHIQYKDSGVFFFEDYPELKPIANKILKLVEVLSDIKAKEECRKLVKELVEEKEVIR